MILRILTQLISAGIVASCMLALAGPVHADARHVLILAPQDKVLVEKRSVLVVVKVASNAFDELELLVNGKKLPLLLSGRQLLCYGGVKLARGKNLITVRGYNENRIAEQSSVTLFSGSALIPGDDEPSDFRRYVFHTTQNEAQCRQCHNMASGDADLSGKPEKSPCYVCHKNMLANISYVHGPAAVWSCSVCHSRNQGKGASTIETDDQACAQCHSETMDQWKKQKYWHGPTQAGLCTVCHNPHGSNLPCFVRMSLGHLCNSCHEKKILQPHVITAFSRNGHPLNVTADKARLGMTISCASCHNPHAGDNPRFLIGYQNGSLTAFCGRCHKF